MRLLLTGLHVLLLLPGHLTLLLLLLLLLLRLVSLLLGQLLMLLFLLLLELLTFLRLLRSQLLLLLLIFLVCFGVPGVGNRRVRNGRELVGVNSSAGARNVVLGPRSLMVVRSCSLGSCSLGVGPGLRSLSIVLRRPWDIVLRPRRLRLSIDLGLI